MHNPIAIHSKKLYQVMRTRLIIKYTQKTIMQKIGFIGLGHMGNPMGCCLLNEEMDFSGIIKMLAV